MPAPLTTGRRNEFTPPPPASTEQAPTSRINVQEVVACLKRGGTGAGKKSLAIILTAVRWFPISVHPFITVEEVIEAGLAAEDGMTLSDEPNTEEAVDEALSRMKSVYALHPAWHDVIHGAAQSISAKQNMTKLMQEKAVGGRSSDLFKVKASLGRYLKDFPQLANTVNEYNTQWCVQQIRDDPSLLDWSHPTIARMLIPMSLVEWFESDVTTAIDEVLTGKKEVNTSEWPAFCYDEDMYKESQADLDEPDELEDAGLFRGEFVINTLQVLLSNNVSIKTGTVTGRKTPAEKHNLEAIQGIHVAYAVTMARAYLAGEGWKSQHLHFDHDDFYENVCRYFEYGKNDNRVKETLKYWNEHVPLNTHVVKKTVKKGSTGKVIAPGREYDPVLRIFQQRAARTAREKEAAQQEAASAQRRLTMDGATNPTPGDQQRLILLTKRAERAAAESSAAQQSVAMVRKSAPHELRAQRQHQLQAQNGTSDEDEEDNASHEEDNAPRPQPPSLRSTQAYVNPDSESDESDSGGDTRTKKRKQQSKSSSRVSNQKKPRHTRRRAVSEESDDDLEAA